MLASAELIKAIVELIVEEARNRINSGEVFQNINSAVYAVWGELTFELIKFMAVNKVKKGK